jgi:hypothetical protein
LVSQQGSITTRSDPSGRFTVPHVLHVPKLSMNLFSVSQLTDHNCTVSLDASSCSVQDRLTGKQIGTGRRLGGLYCMDQLHLSPSSAGSAFFGTSSSSLFDLIYGIVVLVIFLVLD